MVHREGVESKNDDGGSERYIAAQSGEYQSICQRLQSELSTHLPEAENKVWHGHPVWFINGNPVAGYSVQQPGVRLMFWSGVEFDEPQLIPGTGKFKDASIFFQSVGDVQSDDIARWCDKAQTIQWDYKNLIKRKGKLERIV